MRLFDTHCHFETTDESAIRAVLERAKAAGVEALTAVGGSDALNAGALMAQRISSTYCNKCSLPRVHVALGYDREQVGVDSSATAGACATGAPGLASAPVAPVAIGEIGLDYHYSPETREEQMKLFARQLEEARQKRLPVVIHTREAAADTVALLKEIPSRGIIHCFTGEVDEARQYLDLGFFVSISGIVTFRLADNVRATARFIPDDRILIETDAPFLAPVPMRGKPNEPAFLRHTCAFLANLRGVSDAAFADLTFANAVRAVVL